MEQKIKNEIKPKKILEFIKNSYINIILVLTALQGLAVFQPINLFYLSLLFVLNILLFLFIKDLIEENKKKKGFKIFKISIILFVYDLIGLLRKTVEKYFIKGKSVYPLIILFGIGAGIGLLALFFNDKVKEFLNNIYDQSILMKLKLTNDNENEAQKGDIVICIDKETNKPVIIPYKDRFLHMLILGPTGCGKTSQILIPMIKQDIEGNQGVTVIEPKGDLAEKTFAMAKYYGRDAIYFNPTLPDCPYFNPIYGPEDEVIENMATTFKMLNPDSQQYFKDMDETLIRNALKVIKRLKGNSATLIDLSTLIYNSQGQGKIMVNLFSRLNTDTVEMAKENSEIASWFLSDYFNERSKTYENCSGLRAQVSKITSNMHLRRVLNPPNGENDVNFEKIIEEGKILAISTAQGALRDLGRFLGYFIILNFQSAVFKRPGTENTRRAHFLYIDEFQSYSNPGFADMLTQGRSYRVASHLATQNRALMAMGGGRDGKNFVELVSTNARNVIIFPGGNANDAKYYSNEFGEVTKTKEKKSVSRPIFKPLYGFQEMRYPNESISENEVTEPRFSPSDIIFKCKLGEIIYKIIQNNTVQTPAIGKVSYIPKELNNKLEEMVAEYVEEQEKKFSATLNKKEENNDAENEENLNPVDAVIEAENEKNDEEDNDIEDPNDSAQTNKEENNKEKDKIDANNIDLNDETLDDLI